ncbi:hypothetical protein V5799_022142 [Amblyomma americanum]|uniref:Transmembrane protein n=1 Tax=Amblyomma americanum TaxID=6943 RepID=A0AAQ4FMY5_AMBAM
MCDPMKAQDVQPLLTDQAKMEPRRAEAFLQMPAIPAAATTAPPFPAPPSRWDKTALLTPEASHMSKERRSSRSRPSPHTQRSGKSRRTSRDESGAIPSMMPLPETLRFKMPSPAKSSKGMAPPTAAIQVGTASGKRNYDSASKAPSNVGSFNHENVPAAPHFPKEPTVEQVDRPPNELFCDSKEIHSDVPQDFRLSGDRVADPAGLTPSVQEGRNLGAKNALRQPGQTNINQVFPPPPVGEASGGRRLSEGGGGLVPQDIASAVAPARRLAGILRQHVSFANSSGVLPGDTKSSASNSTETSRTSSSRGFSSEATGSSMAKRMAIAGVCLACVAVLSFWAFYAIAEVVIVSHEFVTENGDPGTVRPEDEGAMELPLRIFSNPSGFPQQTESAGPRGGILALTAERPSGNDTSTEDFTDAIEYT